MKRGHGPTAAAKAKALKTMSLRRSMPHVTQEAFVSLVKFCKDNDISETSSSRRSLQNDKRISLADTPYGPLLVTVPLFATPPHANRDMVVANPMAMLYTAFKAGGGFRQMFMKTLAANPCSPDAPWRIAIYSDEVVPGNQLGLLNARKVWVMYWSFLEYGLHLSNECAWFPLIAEPSIGLKTIQSGISQAFAAVLKLFFGSRVYDFRHGIHLEHGDAQIGDAISSARVFAKLPMILQDGGAHKAVIGCKGETGTRFCLRCLNLVAESSGLVDYDGTDKLVCNIVHESDLLFASDADVRGSIARLVHFKATATAKVYKLRSQAIGFTLLERGVLLTPELDDVVYPVSQLCQDWMHGIFATGMFNIICFLAITSIAVATGSKQIWSDVCEFLNFWTWPGAHPYDPRSNGQKQPVWQRANKIK